MYVLYIHPNNTETVMYAHFINKFLSTHITQQSLVKYVSATGPISFSLACVEACACPRLSFCCVESINSNNKIKKLFSII